MEKLQLDDCKQKITPCESMVQALFVSGRHCGESEESCAYEEFSFTREEQDVIRQEALKEVLEDFKFDSSLSTQDIHELKENMRRTNGPSE